MPIKKSFLLLILFSVFAKSQVTTGTTVMKDPSTEEKIYGNKEPYEQADVVPQFKGDITAFKKTLIEKLNKNKFNSNNKTYVAELNFIIKKDGAVSSVQANGNNKIFNAEVINAFKKMKTEWLPAKYSHWEVPYHVSVPVIYSKDHFAEDDSKNFFGEKKISTLIVFQEVDEKAVFPQSTENFKNIVQLKVGDLASSYPFKMSFTVERDGQCSDLKISGTDDRKNEIIKKAILPIKETWIPAKISGKTVRSRYSINFP